MNLQHTGLGYEYFRCRAGSDDSTVYVHQLLAIAAGADPVRVFDPDHDVHHESTIPWDNRPGNLTVEDARDHRVSHLEGGGAGMMRVEQRFECVECEAGKLIAVHPSDTTTEIVIGCAECHTIGTHRPAGVTRWFS